MTPEVLRPSDRKQQAGLSIKVTPSEKRQRPSLRATSRERSSRPEGRTQPPTPEEPALGAACPQNATISWETGKTARRLACRRQGSARAGPAQQGHLGPVSVPAGRQAGWHGINFRLSSTGWSLRPRH